MALKDDIKKTLNKPAPKWAQVLPGGNRSKVPDVSVFTEKLAKTPTIDVSKNIKNPVGRAVASIGEGMVNIPSKLMRNYGQTFTDIGNGNIYTGKGARQFLARTGENALDVLSMGKGKAAVQLGGKFANGAVPFSEILKQSVRQGAKTGGLYGAGYGLTGELQKDQTSARQVLYQALQNGAIGSVFGGIIGGGLPVAGALPGAVRNSLANRRPGAITKEVIPPHYVPSNETAPFNLKTMRAYPKPGYRVSGTNVAGPNGTRISPVDKLLPEQVVERGRKTPTVRDLVGQVREALPRPGMSIQAVDDPLLQEARKYKSAEKFVKKNDPVQYELYKVHKFGGNPWETENIIRVNLFPKEIVKGKGITKNRLLDILKESYDKGYDNVRPSLGIWTKDGKAFMETLVRDGYIDKNYTVLPKIKEWETKSQLTDIWNKANKNVEIQPLYTEALKYKSAEEFVNGFVKSPLSNVERARKTVSERFTLGDNPNVRFEVQKTGRVFVPKIGKYYSKNEAKNLHSSYEQIPEIKVDFVNETSDRINREAVGTGSNLSEIVGNYKSQLTDIWKKAQGDNGKTLKDLGKEVIEALPRPGMSIQDVSKQRGFAETVSRSPLTDKKVVSLLQDANYTPEKNDALVQRATALVENDIDKATEIALRGDDNMSVATASELIKKYQNDGNFTAAANLTKEIATKLTDAGRFIQAASLYNRLTPQGILRYANNELAPHGLELDENDVKVLTEMAKKAGSLTGEDKIIATGKMLQKVQELVPSSFMDKLVTVWKAGLLTNPTTHIANVGGNVTMTGLEAIKDIPATGLDMAASLFTGKRTKTLPSLGAMGSGAWQGAKKAGTFLKTGVDVDQTLGKIDYKQVNIPPVLKQYTQAVFRTLGATDKVFKETLLKKSLHEQAVVDGINRGLSGAQLAEHAKNLYQNPSIQMVETATKDALYGTFNSPNKAAQALGNSAAMNVVAPFKRTPMNIANTILDYSPIGIAKTAYRGVNGSGQRDVVEGLSRALVGSGIIGAGYGLGEAGKMTGNYPQNETERNLWEATGRQPGALKVDDNWQSLNRVSPVGNLLSIGSGMADLGRIKPENVPLAMLSTAGGNLLNQTYLQGVSSLLNAVQDPKRYASSWAENLAKGVIPSVVGAAARYVDPTKRQTNSIGEAVQSRIPGMSQSLLPKVDVFGRKIQNESNPFINPFNTTKAKDTPVTNEIWRLYKNYAGVSLGDPNQSASIGQGLKVELTPEEYTSYQQKTGGVFGNLLNTLISSKQYKGLSDYDKSKAINETVSKVRQMWVMQNARSLQGFPDVYNQIQRQVKLRTPSFFTK